jgi:hypothetical protein
MSADTLSIVKGRWHGRESYTIANDRVRLVTVTGGGHITELSFTGPGETNPLWGPPWETIDPQTYNEDLHSFRYGSGTEGKLLSGLAGHNICLDYFGSPSPEEARQGLSQHGEAPSSRWIPRVPKITASKATLRLKTRLPVARLEFEREIALAPDESAFYIRETIKNLARADHFFHWTQHVTFGPPYLTSGDVTISLPGGKGCTFPHGYDEGKALLALGKTFDWPQAPSNHDGLRIDLSTPLSRKGLGYVAGVQLDPSRKWGFIAAVNSRLGLLVAYLFRRTDFPWVTLWEENEAIEAVPWCKKTIALGVEFGTTPLPVPRRENFLVGGPLFGTPTITYIPALGVKTVRYIALLAKVPKTFERIADILIERREIVIRSTGGEAPIRLSTIAADEFASDS